MDNRVTWSSSILALFCIICLVGIVLLPVNGVSKIFAVAAVVNFGFFTYFFKNFYNPASLFMSMFLFMIGCSQAKLTPIEQDDFAPATWMVLFTVIICFYSVVAAFILRYGRMALKEAINTGTGISARTLFWSNMICVIVESFLYWYVIHKIGSIPLFDDNARANIMPKVVSNYMMTLMVLPTFFIIFNTIYVTESRKYSYLLFSAIYLGLMLLLGGRINIFIPVMTSLFYGLIQYFFAKENKSTLLIINVITLIYTAILMVLIPLMRTQIYVQDQQIGTQYYEAIYNTPVPAYESPNTITPEPEEKIEVEDPTPPAPSLELPPQMKSIWVNLSSEMHAFNRLVIYLNKTDDFREGRMLMTGTFRFVTKYFMPEETLDLVKMGGYEWFNIMTFMHKPYMDFGVYGVAVFMLLFTWVGMALYLRIQKRKNLLNTLLYSYFCMAMLFMVFDNHFYYSTFVVNVILLLLFKAFMSRDWLAKFTITNPYKRLQTVVNEKAS